MCSPTAAIVAGGVISGTAGLIGAQQEAATQEGQAAIAENEARFLDIQAGDIEDAGATAATQIRQATSAALAQNVSATAGAGIDIGGATAREVFLSTEIAGIEDVIQTQINAKKKAQATRESARLKRFEARALKKSAKLTQRLAPLLFASPIVSGVGQARLAQAGSK